MKRRNNTSLANVRCCVAQMPEIKMRDRKQGKKVANRTEIWGKGSEVKTGGVRDGINA